MQYTLVTLSHTNHPNQLRLWFSKNSVKQLKELIEQGKKKIIQPGVSPNVYSFIDYLFGFPDFLNPYELLKELAYPGKTESYIEFTVWVAKLLSLSCNQELSTKSFEWICKNLTNPNKITIYCEKTLNQSTL